MVSRFTTRLGDGSIGDSDYAAEKYYKFTVVFQNRFVYNADHTKKQHIHFKKSYD